MRKYIFTFLLSLGVLYSGYSQKFTKFSSDSEKYLEEMDKLFSRSSTNYGKGKDLLDEIEIKWTTGVIAESNKQNIYLISNLLLKKRARAFPHFYEYLNTINTFYKQQVNPTFYAEWEKGLIALLKERKTKLHAVQRYMKSMQNLILYNSLYYSSSVKWFVDNNNYNVVFENDSLKIIFNSLNIKAKLRRDSIIIHETSGVFYPINNTWQGGSAKVYWDRVGLSRDSVYAEIKSYKLNLKKSYYKVPNVKFYNKYYFSYPLVGTLSDKVVESKRKVYPKFESNEKRFKINNLFEDINFVGGFNMNGDKVLGTGSKTQNAELSLYRDVEYVENGDTLIHKELFIRLRSMYYTLTTDNIVALNAKVSMYLDKDSIYHAGLMFKYTDKNREVNFIRDDNPENMSRSLYYNTYHNIEMDFELLKWQMGNKRMDFTMLRGSAINIAQFESLNYFSESRYYEAQGLEDIHPYVALRRFRQTYHTEEFTASQFARFIRQSMTVTKRLLIKLTYKGIVDYDFETEVCKIRPKLYNYLDAVVGKIDYDLIKLESQTNSGLNNATLDLQNLNLAINGVPMVNVSDSQNVIFYPSNAQITMKKNRDFTFGGMVEAGLFQHYGKDFRFDYDSFKIVLKNIDSLAIKVQVGVNNWGRRKLENVNNVLEHINGEIVIDNPNNKSGVKDNPEYPIFYSTEKSYVYYDYDHIQKGKYTRDKFYFVVEEYIIDSLNDFTVEGLGYDGTLFSADIFPPIQDRLVLQDDNSLGFKRKEADGIVLYKGKGRYINDIWLSNQGLRGNGTIEYLTATAKSDDFIFYPDSTNGITTSFVIDETKGKVEYPQIQAEKIYMHWMPYLDNLRTESIGESFVMYNGKAEYAGALDYKPDKLLGAGSVMYNNGKISSEMLDFKSRTFDSDTANLEINATETKALALKTNNVKTHVDFDAMESKFQSNNPTERTHLPENLYYGYVQLFNWKMLEQNIQMVSEQQQPELAEVKQKSFMADKQDTIVGSLFVSTHKGQDSLNWISSVADFDLNNSILKAHKVEMIKVADASVIPNEGEVQINKTAQMRTLSKARLVANNISRLHKFHDATINIRSRKKYHGDGKYYYEHIPDKKQVINFDVIAVDSTGITFAKGKIKGVEDFSLSPQFAYQGLVELYAPNPLFQYNGYTKINHECNPELAESWIKFSSEINPDSIYIPIEDPLKDINDGFLVSGPMTATDSMYVYPAFVSPRNLYSNFPVATASDYLRFNKGSKAYEIGSKIRMFDNDTTGNFLSLDTKSCKLYSDGEINTGANLGQVKFKTWGNSYYKTKEDELKLDLFATLNYFMPPEALKMISDTLQSLAFLEAVELKGNLYEKGLKNVLGHTAANLYLKEQNMYGGVKVMPEPLTSAFVFNKLQLKWRKKSHAWRSEGKLGIVNINGIPINKKVKGYLEIIRRRSGDEMNLYLELTPKLWYYFNYRRGLMQMYSSYSPFNEFISNIKGSDRKLKVHRGEASYVFFLSNVRKKKKFIKRMKEPDAFVEEEPEEDPKKKGKNKDDDEEEEDSNDDEDSEDEDSDEDYQQYEED